MDAVAAIGFPAAVLVALIVAVWFAVRARGATRAWAIVCALMIGGGAALAIGCVFFPPEEYDEAGNLIGEMPKAFGAGLYLAALGVLGVVAGLAARRLHRAIRTCRGG